MKPVKQISLFLVMALCLVSYACSASTIITDIDIAAQAASVAVPIVLAATGLPASLQSTIIAYLTAANEGLGCAASATEASTDPATVSAAILKCLAGLNIAPTLPAGVAQNVAAVVQALASDIANIINQYAKVGVNAGKLQAAAGSGNWKLSFGDHQMLGRIHKTVDMTAGYLATHPQH
jgi:hypothetical protein